MLIHHHKTLCVCDFTNLLELSQPKISRHLAQLRECGIVSDSRKGRWVYYSLNNQLPEWCSRVIAETFEASKIELASLLEKKLTTESCCE